LKRDTRHARRRASLATSSTTIPTDSRASAPHCHACVITLSTEVTHFGVFLAQASVMRARFASNDRSSIRCNTSRRGESKVNARRSGNRHDAAHRLQYFTTKTPIWFPK
jgi:hypothetical protein